MAAVESERVLREAEFGDAPRYYALSAAIPLVLSVVLIPVAIIAVPIVFITRMFEYRFIRCALCERVLKVHRGIFTKVEKTIPLDKITDLGVEQSFVMRWCGVETLQIETAGQSSGPEALVRLVGVRDARAFRDAVLAQRDLLADAESKPVSGAERAIADPREDTLREIANTLRRIERSLSDRGD